MNRQGGRSQVQTGLAIFCGIAMGLGAATPGLAQSSADLIDFTTAEDWAIAPLSLSACCLEGDSDPAFEMDAETMSFAIAQAVQPVENPNITASDRAEDLDLPPEAQNSPVLRRWQSDPPDVLDDIARDPSFRTRLRVGYAHFPSSDDTEGISVGVEDIFLGRTGLTLSADYHDSFEGDRLSYGTELRYYIRPLGRYFNLAPSIGYRVLETEEYSEDGVSLGFKVLLALSRTGAADISLSQQWLNLGQNSEIGLTTLSLGYALTHHLRLSTDFQRQKARQDHDSRVSFMLEWML
jgi:hypothetical protein